MLSEFIFVDDNNHQNSITYNLTYFKYKRKIIALKQKIKNR